MTIQVFHVALSRAAQEDRAVLDVYYQLSHGAEKTVKEVLLSPALWMEKGLSYCKVAEVEGGNLERAYALTNHIDTNWTENQGVTLFPNDIFPRGPRSTSIGDLMRVDEGDYMLASTFGFEPIELPASQIDKAVALFAQKPEEMVKERPRG